MAVYRSGMDSAYAGATEQVLLPEHARRKRGNDIIFAWLSRCQAAKDAGEDVVNGTIGALLEDDGQLAVNIAVNSAIHDVADFDRSAYSPLPGLRAYRIIARSLTIGPRLDEVRDSGLASKAIASPGGCGALYMTARNLADPGDKMLLRSNHWGPYKTILAECDLERAEWPLTTLNPINHPVVDDVALRLALRRLADTQRRVLGWINDPAHNPTGLSLDAAGRRLVLDAWIEAARESPDIGFSLVLDTAYAAYADERHGWTDTVLERSSNWPNNFFLCWAFSASKSHTMYGLRCGALVMLHPETAFLERMMEVCLHTGRGTWSGTPRLPQAAIVAIHSDAEKESEWAAELMRLRGMLTTRRTGFIDTISAAGVQMMPSMDGYFAFLPDSNPAEICEAAASRGVYVVPLRGGVRIGICSMATEHVERAAAVIAECWHELRGAGQGNALFNEMKQE